MPKPKLFITCPACGEHRLHKSKGLCEPCYRKLKKPKPTAPRVRLEKVCTRCGLLRPYKGRGLCTTCHSNETNVIRRSSFTVCSTCNEAKPTYVKVPPTCLTCYESARHKQRYTHRYIKPSCCSDCGKVVEHYIRGACRSCYDSRRIRSGPYQTCFACKELKPHVAKGLCRKCYSKTVSTRRPLITCSACGLETQHKGWGLCAPCYQQANREVRRRWFRRRYATDPAFRFRALQFIRRRKRRLAELGVSGSHTHEEWLELLEFFKHRCAYCSKDIHGCATEDHIIPISSPGSSDGIENIVPACPSCNSRKGTMTVAAFIQLLGPETSEFLR